MQSDTDLCLFYNPVTRLRAAVHVDDVFVRGGRYQTKIIWAGGEVPTKALGDSGSGAVIDIYKD